MNEICLNCRHLIKTTNQHRKHWIYECTLENCTFPVDMDVIDIYNSLQKCPNKKKFELLYKLKDV